MSIPSWYGAVLLSLAAFRVWALLARDSILDGPRQRAIFLIRKRSTRAAVSAKEMLDCPWCAGFWVALGWWGAWEAWPHGALIAAVPFALSTIVAALGSVLDS